MATRFTIPSRSFTGLETLIEIGNSNLLTLAENLRGRPLTLDLSRLANDLATTISIKNVEKLIEAFRTVLMPLNDLRVRTEITPEDFVTSLIDQIRLQKPEWFSKNQEGIEGIQSGLQSLIRPDGYFNNLNKAFRLVTNHHSVASSINIITEARPVYDNDVTRLLAMLLTSSLVVEYEGRRVSIEDDVFYGRSKGSHLDPNASRKGTQKARVARTASE